MHRHLAIGLVSLALVVTSCGSDAQPDAESAPAGSAATPTTEPAASSTPAIVAETQPSSAPTAPETSAGDTTAVDGSVPRVESGAAVLGSTLQRLGLSITDEQSKCLDQEFSSQFSEDDLKSFTPGNLTPEMQQAIIGLFTACDINLADITKGSRPLTLDSAAGAALETMLKGKGATEEQAKCTTNGILELVGEKGLVDALRNMDAATAKRFTDVGVGCGLTPEFFS